MVDVTAPVFVATLAALSAEMELQPELDDDHQVLREAVVNMLVNVMDHDS